VVAAVGATVAPGVCNAVTGDHDTTCVARAMVNVADTDPAA